MGKDRIQALLRERLAEVYQELNSLFCGVEKVLDAHLGHTETAISQVFERGTQGLQARRASHEARVAEHVCAEHRRDFDIMI